MVRPKAHKAGNAAVRAERQLRREFAELQRAMSDWLDYGDFNAIDVALDTVMGSLDYYPYAPIDEDKPRDERIVLLGQRLATANQIATRLGRELRAIEKARTEIRDQLLATIAEPAQVPEYVVKLWKRLQAVGATQIDLQPQSKALAKAMLEAARAHNKNRKPNVPQEEDESIATWADLPREFAGFRLRDIGPDEATKLEPCPLPPSPDIADFTADGQRPAAETTRRETLIAWTNIIKDWAIKNRRELASMDATTWAMLLAHRLPNDESDVRNLYGIQLQSPWGQDEIVVVERAPQHRSTVVHEDDEDDIPY